MMLKVAFQAFKVNFARWGLALLILDNFDVLSYIIWLIMDEKTLFRIIDANVNRCMEGLRVIEEIARFHHADHTTTSALKKMRQKISQSVRSVELYRKLLEARDVDADIGAPVEFDAQNLSRESLIELLRANFQRAKESSRALEEFSKLPGSGLGKEFKEIRFSLYALEKSFMTVYLSDEEKK